MITRSDVIAAIRQVVNESELEDWPEDEWSFDNSDAAQFIDELGVHDATERVEMFNQASNFDLDDLVALANVSFHVVTCDMCGEDVYVVQPDDWSMFQCIVTHGEIAPVEINGKEKQICDECYGDPIFH